MFKPSTVMDIKAIGNTLTASAFNTVDDEVLNLSATAAPNSFGGAGVYWSGTVPNGNSNVYSMIEVSYPEFGWNLALSGTAVGANLPAGARVGTLSTSTGTDTFTYSLVVGAGSGDNDAFAIDGDVLRTSRPLDAGRTYSVRIRSTNQDGFLVEHAFTISTVSLACTADPTLLWPPNGKAVPVAVAGAFSPDAAGIVAGSVAYAVADEYAVVQPTGSVVPDTKGNFAFTVPLTAFREGADRDGRAYRVVVSGTDTSGNTVSCTASATVPHDQR